MKWSDHTDKLCPIAKSLGIVGEYWSLLILRNAFMGVKRFDEFQEQLGMTRHVLADRLKKLVQSGVMEKAPYGENQGRYEYRLTEMGVGLYPVIMSLADWGNTWLFEEGQQPIKHVHTDCGNVTKPIMVCSDCGEPLKPRQTKIIAGEPIVKVSVAMEEQAATKELGFPVPHTS